MFITSGQPSLNPRLVKEADTLAANGYDVKVIYAYWNTMGAGLNDKMLPHKGWSAIPAGGNPINQPLTYLLSRTIFKLAGLFSKATGSMALAKFAVARSSYFLIQEAKRHQADLYIGHNLGSLPAIVAAAKKYNKPCGFDAEDFHRNEISDDPDNYHVRLKTAIEDKYIPRINYLSASSAEIADAYRQLYHIQPLVLTNVFPKSGYTPALLHANKNQPLKLFWFSQTIGPKRGLECLIAALEINGHSFELHLLGYCSNEYKQELAKGKIAIYFHQPIPPDDLAAFARQFDIGLALEPGFSINNNLALSNKIFTYMQAGLAIVASDTTAQAALINQHPQIGKIFLKDDPASLATVLTYYHQHRDKLMAARMAALLLAQTELNWETESQKFLTVINNLLAN